MPTKKPSQKKIELIANKRKQLLELGYMPGIVDKAMDWAASSADGMARYALGRADDDEASANLEQLIVQFLPQFLNDCEKYMRAFDHERGENKPKS